MTKDNDQFEGRLGLLFQGRPGLGKKGARRDPVLSTPAPPPTPTPPPVPVPPPAPPEEPPQTPDPEPDPMDIPLHHDEEDCAADHEDDDIPGFDWIAPQPPAREPAGEPEPAKENGLAQTLLKILEIAQSDQHRIEGALQASAEVEDLDLTVRILNVTARMLELNTRVDGLMERAEDAANAEEENPLMGALPSSSPNVVQFDRAVDANRILSAALAPLEDALGMPGGNLSARVETDYDGIDPGSNEALRRLSDEVARIRTRQANAAMGAFARELDLYLKDSSNEVSTHESLLMMISAAQAHALKGNLISMIEADPRYDGQIRNPHAAACLRQVDLPATLRTVAQMSRTDLAEVPGIDTATIIALIEELSERDLPSVLDATVLRDWNPQSAVDHLIRRGALTRRGTITGETRVDAGATLHALQSKMRLGAGGIGILARDKILERDLQRMVASLVQACNARDYSSI